MIIRVFQGQAQPGMHGDFERMSREVAIPQVQAQAGLLHLSFETPMEEQAATTEQDTRAFPAHMALRSRSRCSRVCP